MSAAPASLLRPERRSLLPTVAAEEIERLLQTPDGAERYAAWLRKRERTIALAESDPLHYGWEPPAWQLPDSQLDVAETVAVFGANRTTKSYWAGRRFCEAAMTYPGGVLVALSEKDEASVATQQKIVWHYLRPHVEKYNNRRDTRFKVNYTQANGFTEGKLVLPPPEGAIEGTEIYFLTYKQVASDYEGWEFGARVRELALRPNGRPVHNIGWWADESLTIAWLEVLKRRAPFRKAKGLWTYTPIRG